MGYRYETQYDSPNYTAGRQGNRIAGITIHHWGVDGQKHDDVVRFLCRQGGNTSAHYVVSGGRVTCIVAPGDTAWHAGNWQANCSQIGIECRPECTSGDMKTVAELIADLRKTYGYLPLSPHKRFFNTACPGRWEAKLGWLDKRAEEIRNGKSTPTQNTAVGGEDRKKKKMRNVGIYWKAKDGSVKCAILNTSSGFWAAHSNGNKFLASYNNPLAIAFDTPSWAEVTEAHAAVLQARCEQVRKGA